jgi:hypothetical protein
MVGASARYFAVGMTIRPLPAYGGLCRIAAALLPHPALRWHSLSRWTPFRIYRTRSAPAATLLQRQSRVLCDRQLKVRAELYSMSLFHRQKKRTVQHNALMSYNIVLHVAVRIDHYQALLVKTNLKKERKHLLECNCSVSEISLTFVHY